MNWYAIRLKPNAQRPSKKDPRITNIELSLQREGFEVYMPLERRMLIHHRTKKPIDRWFPLIPGYAFVVGPCYWTKLEGCDYVAGILGTKGTPIPFRDAIIDLIKQQEAKFDKDYEEAKIRKRIRDEEKEERKEHIPQSRLRVMYPAGAPIAIDSTYGMFGGRRGRVVDATGRNTIKAIIETLNGMVNVEIPVPLVELAS
jgi:transcription antitermination factor NusG